MNRLNNLIVYFYYLTKQQHLNITKLHSNKTISNCNIEHIILKYVAISYYVVYILRLL